MISAHMFRGACYKKYCASDDVFNAPLEISPLYIYIYMMVNLAKSMRFLTDSSSVNLSLHCEFFFGTMKVE